MTQGPRGFKFRSLLALARAVLLWERLWIRMWPVLAVAGLFLAIALLDVLPLLPSWIHGVVLVSFAAVLAWMLRRAVRGFPGVTEAQVRLRLERDSGLENRPLAALDDHLMAGSDDRVSRGLWERHRDRMRAAIRKLRVGFPAPGLARHDPLALRAAVALVLTIGLAAGWNDVPDRLLRAVSPLPAGFVSGPLRTAIWITPPAYTGKAPVFLERVGEQPEGDEDPSKSRLVVPVGSSLLVQVAGLRDAPDLQVGELTVPFDAVGDSGTPGARSSADRRAEGKGGETPPPAGPNYRTEAVIDESGEQTLAVSIGGRTLISWGLDVVADAAPQIEFISKPSSAGRAALRTEFEARDDYGLAGASLIIRHPNGRRVAGGSDEIRLRLTLSEPGAVLSQGTSVHDLSAHPWAGIEVVGLLEAVDGLGQVGRSDDLKFILPQRTFNHPVARALVEQRRALSDPTPEVIEEVINVLSGIAAKPKHFFDDSVVFLSLSIAQGRLRHDGDEAAIAAVQKLLWETALRLEDGDFALAERDVLDLQKRLQNALNEGADSEEVERLMEQLRQALDQYLEALAEQLQRENLTESPAFDENLQTLESTDLQRLLDEAQELARSGAQDAARQMLSQLQRALEAIRNGLARAPQQQQQLEEARRLMQGLRELTDRQRKLLDETFEEARRQRQEQRRGPGSRQVERLDELPPPGARQRGARRPGERQGRQGQRQGQEQGAPGDRQAQRGQRGQGQNPGQGQGGGAGQQEALRRALGEIMLQMDQALGNIPGALGEAERAMRGASQALSQGKPGNAVPKQTEALEKLEQASRQASQQMAQQLGGGMRLGQRGGRGRRDQGRDPFGRGPGGPFGSAVDGDTEIPSRMERRRARDILQELRRRAGERERPTIERDYIDRLLQQF